MMIKIFEGMNHNIVTECNQYPTLEQEVQRFLDDNPNIKIHHIKQSSTSEGSEEVFEGQTCISIWYTEN